MLQPLRGRPTRAFVIVVPVLRIRAPGVTAHELIAGAVDGISHGKAGIASSIECRCVEGDHHHTARDRTKRLEPLRIVEIVQQRGELLRRCARSDPDAARSRVQLEVMHAGARVRISALQFRIGCTISEALSFKDRRIDVGPAAVQQPLGTSQLTGAGAEQQDDQCRRIGCG